MTCRFSINGVVGRGPPGRGRCVVCKYFDNAKKRADGRLLRNGEEKDCHAGFGMLANYGRCTRPSVGGFFYSRQGEPMWAHGNLSRSVTTVSPYWYIRGRPHAALSGVRGPRERQAFPSVCRLGS